MEIFKAVYVHLFIGTILTYSVTNLIGMMGPVVLGGGLTT